MGSRGICNNTNMAPDTQLQHFKGSHHHLCPKRLKTHINDHKFSPPLALQLQKFKATLTPNITCSPWRARMTDNDVLIVVGMLHSKLVIFTHLVNLTYIKTSRHHSYYGLPCSSFTGVGKKSLLVIRVNMWANKRLDQWKQEQTLAGMWNWEHWVWVNSSALTFRAAWSKFCSWLESMHG